MTATTRPAEAHPSLTTPKPLAWLYVIASFIGLVASMTLTVEKFELAEDASYVPTCSFGESFSCGSVMISAQAAAFGIPNPLLGIAGFAVVMAIGVIMLTGAALPRWFRTAFVIGLGLATIFCLWLAYHAVYVIGALCIYCMVVWVVTITMFWFAFLRFLGDAAERDPDSGLARTHATLNMLRFPILLAVLFLIAALIVIEFRFFF
ncbi:vitamin K epoxide reductase family protein [uncultured Corynebacterium sp.]|uniref:vitamin K epoxide reductase family protein n=1 Tax=uncultured Corynebacterium sp. TaxID=159447 RepID=UPI0025EDC972|nr:vitamin K epoxide reductase family protein [uncultured Corynebacterium sp.]